jgi:hypothetical protein
MLIDLVTDLSGKNGMHIFAQCSAVYLCVCDQCDSCLLLRFIDSPGGILLSLFHLALVSLGIFFSLQSPVESQLPNVEIVLQVSSPMAALKERIALVFVAHDLC